MFAARTKINQVNEKNMQVTLVDTLSKINSDGKSFIEKLFNKKMSKKTTYFNLFEKILHSISFNYHRNTSQTKTDGK